ncbi:MAG: NADH-quinone oxidoreductase subunit N [Rubrivivax sp.]
MNAHAVFMAMLPEHTLLLGIVVLVLLVIVLPAERAQRAALAVAGLSVAAAALAAALLALQGYSASPFAGQLSVSPGPLLAKAMVLALALPVVLMAGSDFGNHSEHGCEFTTLLLSSLYGACLVQSADSFLTLFLGLEILSLPVYVLVLLAWHQARSAEAALKYLVLGGMASAMLLMGASLLYGSTASLAIGSFVAALASADALQRTALVLIILAFFLKAAIVPFHTWAPDAYEGASVPVTAYMAVVVKAAVLLAALRLFAGGSLVSPLLELVAVLPLVSIVWGNLTAMRQPSLRRMIAYSSIAHAGYLFYALLGEPSGRLQSVAFYVLAYGLLNLLVFAALPPADDDAARDRLDHLKGLFHRSPFAAIMIALGMLSLAGIPPLPGFVAKFLIFRNVMAAGYTVYAVLGLVGSYLGIYFYLRVIQFMFMSEDTKALPVRRLRLGAATASIACLGATLLLAVLPGWVMARW